MSQKSEVKSKIIIDETGIIDGSGANGIIKGNNSTFDADIGDWLEYTDAVQALPEDGAGAAAADLTVERTTFASEILDGNGSLKITKANLANAQGQGASLTIPVPKANRAQPHKLSFDFDSAADFVPANPADPVGTPGDVGVYLYDVTNSKLLTPNQLYITSGKGRYESLVQLPSDCEEARVILHVQSTSTDLWVLFVDNVKLDIASNQTVSNMSDYVDWTPTGTLTTNTTYTGKYRINGDMIDYDVSLNFAGAPNAANITINLPFEIDTNKLTNTDTNVPIFGKGIMLDTAVSAFDAVVAYNNSSSVNVNVFSQGGSYSAEVPGTNAIPFVIGAGDKINVRFSVPSVGLTSGTVHPAAQGLNAQVVMKAHKSGGSLTAGATITNYTNIDKDSVGGFDATTGIYTIQSPGDYHVYANVATTVAGGSRFLQIYLNGTEVARGSNSGSDAYDINHVLLPDLKYGDQITLEYNQNTTLIANPWGLMFQLFKIGSEQQPYAPRIAYIKDVKTSGTSNSDTISATNYVTRTLNTIEGDSNFVSISSNQITLQPGTYHIEVQAPIYRSLRHKLRLRNITDSTNDIIGMVGFNSVSDAGHAHSELVGTISISSTKVFEIQQYSENGGGAGNASYGLAGSTGDDEVYTQAKITKVL